MAEFGFNHWGAVLTLEHDEVEYAINAAKAGGVLAPEVAAALGAAGVISSGLVSPIGAVLVGHLARS
jgi:hypothetical protein